MSERPWHKRYHSDAIAGFMGLSLEERGAYQTLLDLMYDRQAPLIDDTEDRMRLIAGYLGVGLRKYRSVTASLIQKGKLYRLPDGRLSNKRFEKEIKNKTKTSEKRAKNGKLGGEKKAENWKKTNKNNDSSYQELEQKPSYNQKPEARSQSLENKTTDSAVSGPPETAAHDLQAIGDRCLEAMGISPKDPHWRGHYGFIAAWIANGWDVQLDILPTIKAVTARRTAKKQGLPRTLSFFTDAIADAYRNRVAARRPASDSSNVVQIGEQVTLRNGRQVPRPNALVHLKHWWFEQLGEKPKSCYAGMQAWGAYDPPGHPDSVWPDDLVLEAKKIAQDEISELQKTAG